MISLKNKIGMVIGILVALAIVAASGIYIGKNLQSNPLSRGQGGKIFGNPTEKQDASSKPAAWISPIMGQQHFAIGGKDSADGINILFIPQRITDLQTIGPIIKKLFSGDTINGKKGLLDVAPFNKYSDRFNVSYMDKNIDENLFDCQREEMNPDALPKFQYYHWCDWEKIKQYYGIYDPNYIVLIFDNMPAGYSSYGGEIQQLQADLPNINDVFIHEFGHQFGGLADEYGGGAGRISDICGTATDDSCYNSYLKEISPVPNIDRLGCPKWCNSYDLSGLLALNENCSKYKTQDQCTIFPGCTWFVSAHPFLHSNCVISDSFDVNIGKECQEGAQCIFGANYGQFAFKSSLHNIMKDMVAESGFDEPSMRHLDKIMQCCYPRIESADCNNFRDKFKNLPSETNPYLAIAYAKIFHCGQ